MTLIFTIIYVAWILSEILISRLYRSVKTDKQNADKGSLYLLWTFIIIGNFSAVAVTNWYPLPLYDNPVIGYIGVAIIIIGMLIRFVVIASLNIYFTVDVTIKQDHKLKKDGFYKYVRHPSYFASFISFVGFGISLNNWLSLTIVTFFFLVAFSIRIKIEEKVLTEHFGSEYLDYKKHTKRLIPFIY